MTAVGDDEPDLIEAAAARRADGTYPPGADEALEAEARRRLDAARTHTTALRAAVERVRELGPFEVPRYRGRNPGKAVYDRLVHRAVGHALADLVRQLEAYRSALDRVLDEVVEVTEGARADGER